MHIIQIIAYSSIIIWLLIPLRQIRTRFFLFFLVLALFDPIAFIWGKFLHSPIAIPYILGTAILPYTILFEVRKEIKLFIISALILSAAIFLFFFKNEVSILQIVVHLIIFIYFLKIMIVNYSEQRSLMLFHLLILAYEFSLLLKFFVIYRGLEVGIAYYYLTTSFQSVIGILFLLFSERNSPKLNL